jgi:hypothetical protein
MVDLQSVQDSKRREAQFAAQAASEQAKIDKIKFEEAQRKAAPPSDNIFTRMADAFKRQDSEGRLANATNIYKKHQDEDHAKMARDERVIQEKEFELNNKINQVNMLKNQRESKFQQRMNLTSSNNQRMVSPMNRLSGFISQRNVVPNRSFARPKPVNIARFTTTIRQPNLNKFFGGRKGRNKFL